MRSRLNDLMRRIFLCRHTAQFRNPQFNTRGVTTQLSLWSKENCWKRSWREVELFKQLLSKELNWPNSSLSWAELFEQLFSKELNWSNSSLCGTDWHCIKKYQFSSFERSCSKSSAPIKRAFVQLFRSAELHLRTAAGAPLFNSETWL